MKKRTNTWRNEQNSCLRVSADIANSSPYIMPTDIGPEAWPYTAGVIKPGKNNDSTWLVKAEQKKIISKIVNELRIFDVDLSVYQPLESHQLTFYWLDRFEKVQQLKIGSPKPIFVCCKHSSRDQTTLQHQATPRSFGNIMKRSAAWEKFLHQFLAEKILKKNIISGLKQVYTSGMQTYIHITDYLIWLQFKTQRLHSGNHQI